MHMHSIVGQLHEAQSSVLYVVDHCYKLSRCHTQSAVIELLCSTVTGSVDQITDLMSKQV